MRHSKKHTGVTSICGVLLIIAWGCSADRTERPGSEPSGMLEDNKEVALADSTRAVPIPEEPQPQQLPQDTLRSAMEADLEQAPVATDTLRESQRLIKPTSIPEEPGR